MFNLKLLDHLHLTFAHVMRGERAHAESATRLSRRAAYFRIAELVVLGGAVAASLAAVLGSSRGFAILTAVLASLALAVYVVWLASNFEPRIDAHLVRRAVPAIGERYRALLITTARSASRPRAITGQADGGSGASSSTRPSSIPGLRARAAEIASVPNDEVQAEGTDTPWLMAN
jgi:hypothetical protein